MESGNISHSPEDTGHTDESQPATAGRIGSAISWLWSWISTSAPADKSPVPLKKETTTPINAGGNKKQATEAVESSKKLLTTDDDDDKATDQQEPVDQTALLDADDIDLRRGEHDKGELTESDIIYSLATKTAEDLLQLNNMGGTHTKEQKIDKELDKPGATLTLESDDSSVLHETEPELQVPGKELSEPEPVLQVPKPVLQVPEAELVVPHMELDKREPPRQEPMPVVTEATPDLQLPEPVFLDPYPKPEEQLGLGQKLGTGNQCQEDINENQVPQGGLESCTLLEEQLVKDFGELNAGNVEINLSSRNTEQQQCGVAARQGNLVLSERPLAMGSVDQYGDI